MKVGLAIALLTAFPRIALADDCTAIKFQRGTSGAVVTGTAYSYQRPVRLTPGGIPKSRDL